jgi:hypothetical protein
MCRTALTDGVSKEELMARSLFLIPLLVLAFLAGSLWSSRTDAQDATPASTSGTMTLILVESAGTIVDRFGDDGPSAGDIRVWGPNPLFDETNTTDTGAVTQGSCIGINTNFDCLVNETIIFPDGSTLEIQGLQPGQPVASVRTIVGGSGQYLGATGTVAVSPSEDLAVWTKTIEISGLRGQ